MSCKDCNTHCYEQGSDGKMCMAWTKKPITNADRIRATTDEELAELFYSYGICPPEWRREPCKFSTCRECILCWLKEEAKV